MEEMAGRLPSENAYDVLLTGPARLTMLDGRPLAVYLPGALTHLVDSPGVYDVLDELGRRISRNRGAASGSPRFKSNQTRSYTRPVGSAIAGAIDPGGQQQYCRLTSWTGQNLEKWEMLRPLLLAVAAMLQEYVPERWAVQRLAAQATDPAWVVPGTPFSTITVNNSYSTGIHTDKGDLAAGFSTITCIRKGKFTGGRLVFPEFRVAADLRHGDLILMDAHQWHGNTQLYCGCGNPMNGACEACGAQRLSVVAYFREKLAKCGTPAEEMRRADAYRESAEVAKRKRLETG